MEIHPGLAQFAQPEPDGPLPVDVRMLRADRRARALAAAGAGPPVAAVQDLAAAPCQMRLYRSLKAAPAPAPAVLLVHGGGWVWGGLDEIDALARNVCATTGWPLCSVTYRHAPEHRYPAALDDVDSAVTWLSAHSNDLGLDAGRVAMIGLSAGGNLVAAAALRRRTSTAQVAAQVLAYPMLDPRLGSPSSFEFGGLSALSRRRARWFWEQYLGDDHGADPHAAPAFASELAGLPPSYLVVGEADVLRDETLDYGQRLIEAGVPTTVDVVPGAVHGFLTMGKAAPDLQADVLSRIAGWLRRTLAR